MRFLVGDSNLFYPLSMTLSVITLMLLNTPVISISVLVYRTETVGGGLSLKVTRFFRELLLSGVRRAISKARLPSRAIARSTFTPTTSAWPNSVLCTQTISVQQCRGGVRQGVSGLAEPTGESRWLSKRLDEPCNLHCISETVCDKCVKQPCRSSDVAMVLLSYRFTLQYSSILNWRLSCQPP